MIDIIIQGFLECLFAFKQLLVVVLERTDVVGVGYLKEVARYPIALQLRISQCFFQGLNLLQILLIRSFFLLFCVTGCSICLDLWIPQGFFLSSQSLKALFDFFKDLLRAFKFHIFCKKFIKARLVCLEDELSEPCSKQRIENLKFK